MSSDALAAPRINRAARQAALRLAFGVTVCFALAEYLRWDATFIAPMLAAQMLVKLPNTPTLKQGAGLIALFFLSTYGVLLIALAFLSNPAVLILVLGLILLQSFHAHFLAKPEILTLLIQISAVALPVLAIISPDTALGFAGILAKAGTLAVATVFAAHAIFPAPDGAAASAPAKAAVPESTAARQAIAATLIMLPVLAWFLLNSTQTVDMAIVMMITILTLLRQANPQQGQRVALALAIGNLVGGIAAVIVYNLVTLNGSFAFFVVAVLAASLMFAAAIQTAGSRAPIVAIAFATFILLLGIGTSPLPSGSGEAFASRLINVLIASAYAVGAASLFLRFSRHQSRDDRPAASV